MPFVWSIGTICGPAIGGYFADPHSEWPDRFPANSIWTRFPYLLPNIICASMLLVSIVCGWAFLNETHPDKQPWSTQEDLDNTSAQTPLIETASSTFNAPADLTHDSYGTFDQVQITQRSDAPVLEVRPKVFNKNVVMFIVALGLFTYHSMAYDHLLPIFLQDQATHMGDVTVESLPTLSGGLGLSIKDVGVIMSVNGIIALLVQALIFPLMAHWLGVWKLFIFVTIGEPIALFIVPFLIVIPREYLYVGIYSALTIRNFFYIISYPLILILIKEAAPSPSHLGKINGAAASVGGLCRCFASPVAGILYGLGSDLNFSALAWWAGAAVAVVGIVQLAFIRRQKKMKAHVSAPTAWVYSDVDPSNKDEIANFAIESDSSDDDDSTV